MTDTNFVQATSLSRLRHPCILEVVEPLEETRSELVFATEPLLASLALSIPNSIHRSPIVELDEVEVLLKDLHTCSPLTFPTTDSERHTATLQRAVVPSYLSTLDSQQHFSGKYPYQ